MLSCTSGSPSGQSWMAEPGVDTVAFYEANAGGFAADTRDLDMSALYDRFLSRVPPAGRILDAGCGSGRDAFAFAELGYSVLAIDASLELARLAREYVAGRAKVQRMRFEEIGWTDEFDGIWACASLLHVPLADFPTIVGRLAAALRSGGVCYMSFKYGEGECVNGGRHFTNHTEDFLRAVLTGTAFALSETWVTNDVRAGRSEEHWPTRSSLWCARYARRHGHSSGNPSSRSSSCSPVGCRPSRIASTMSGASRSAVNPADVGRRHAFARARSSSVAWTPVV